ncbi:HIRAN domain-containing protein [Phyllobacterium zundukense]|uniref:HIRAN domain-containing protein n=1 Tax=Phyllobacterium zundukense TaxID=1867719 RepID=A0A2N9W4W7_9HYPH|nr:HIRAN domain-containing protein [Phyllobacterium zundukense]ATU91750.1 hypothetical protein BLM14_09055 [Phyllobacterium zundukense]PIO46785.1 hypothetical protein B5P45_03020 [Phyllobacterium zundukense]
MDFRSSVVSNVCNFGVGMAMGILSFLFGNSKPKDDGDPETGSRPEATSPSPLARIKWRDSSFPMDAVGESNYQDALIAICGAHTRYGHEGEYDALLEREPSNRYDSNAVMVKIRGKKVGYLPREQAQRVGQQMLEAGIEAAVCAARVRGGWRTNQYDEGHYGVRLAIPNHGWIDFGIGAEPPARASLPRQTAKRPVAAMSGPLLGHWIALMGAPPDEEVAQELAAAGAKIMAGVGKSTTLLVVVAERPFDAGTRSSASFRRADDLIAAGSHLRIISLSEARAMIAKSA